MKNISFLRMYLYSVLSIFLWCFIYIFITYFTPRGHHLNEYKIYIVICFVVFSLSLLMVLVYKLFTLVKKLPSFKRDIMFIIFISYSHLPFTVFSMFKEEMIPSFFSMEMASLLFNIKLYLLGVVICPTPFTFIYFINRNKSIDE